MKSNLKKIFQIIISPSIWMTHDINVLRQSRLVWYYYFLGCWRSVHLFFLYPAILDSQQADGFLIYRDNHSSSDLNEALLSMLIYKEIENVFLYNFRIYFPIDYKKESAPFLKDFVYYYKLCQNRFIRLGVHVAEILRKYILLI